MTYDRLQALVGRHSLQITGAFHPRPDDQTPSGTATLVLLSPSAAFWPAFTTSPEYLDGTPDPVDRWSTRVVTSLASELGATPIFPFGGPPHHPFIAWATRSSSTWTSPVTLLVNASQGMMISFRAALALPDRLELPAPPAKPCTTCSAPCQTACPVNALTPADYDVAACKAHASSPAGTTCRTDGCLVRRACPVSAKAHRRPEQSAHHMEYFL